MRMKLLDVLKCHEDSLEFRTGLAQLEDATAQLEKKLKRICMLCEERQTLAERDRSITLQLIREFEFFSQNELDCEDEAENAMSSIEVMTTSLKQLVDNQERLFEQIDIGVLKPLQHFVHHDVEQVKESSKNYQKARTEALQVAERFSQCKRHEMTLLNELSLQLFDARCDLHRASCNYALDLNCLHSKKTPHFLQKLVDYMTSQLSYFHLGHITVKDAEPHINELYGVLERIRARVTSQDTQQRTKAKSLLEQVFLSRTRDLVLFHSTDLHFPLRTSKATIIRHLSEKHAGFSFQEKEVEPVQKKPVQARTKNGYLWYAETRTFGTAWIRLFFSIRKGMLVSSESTSKVKVPISLNLNLCNVKQAQVTDTERNFCFKVISPIRILLLQAESTQDVQCWMDVLNYAILHAIHGHSITPERELLPAGGAQAGTGPVPGATAPPSSKPKSRVNVSKELYSIPGNEVCADCGNSKPKWASINLSVLICIECSGVHRSLGVYVSQVRSLTLDMLKPEWVELMKENGNRKSNAVYEALLPEDFDRDAVRRDDTRQEFIIEKYVAMKYTSPEDKERILRERQEAKQESMKRSAALLAAPKSSEEVMQLTTTANEKSEDSSGAGGSGGGGSGGGEGGGGGSGGGEGGGGEGGGGGSGGEGSGGEGSGRRHNSTHAEGSALRRVKKSLETVKDSVVKFAKNE